MAASHTLTLTPAGGGTPRVINNYVSGAEISDLLASTSYTASIKSLGGIANINSLAGSIEFVTPQDPVEIARLAYLAKLAEIAKAREDVQTSTKVANGLTLDLLQKAEIKGATKENLELINKELAQLSPEKRADFGKSSGSFESTRLLMCWLRRM